MKFKKDFYQIAWEIKAKAYETALRELMREDYHNGYISATSMINEAIARAISHAIYDSLDTLKCYEYTDEDFEKDIGLKP